MKRKIFLTAAFSVLLLCVYIMIFQFSADQGEASSNLSMKVSKWLVKLYYAVTGQQGTAPVAPVAGAWEGTVRKLAHMTEYMAVGFLAYSVITLWIKGFLRGIGLAMLQLLLSGALDELHQYFVPGRHASLYDVGIDMAGGMAGIAVVLLGKGIKRGWSYLLKRE